VGGRTVRGVTELAGRRVRLRPPTDDDVAPLAEIRRHPELHHRWRGGDDKVAAVREDMAEDGSTGLVIEADGRVVGWIQYSEELEPDYLCASIDIYVDATVHGQGIGTDAIRTLARHLFDDRGHHHITIDPAADNAAAIACYRKVGFRPVGVLRQAERSNDGTWHDALMMDMLRADLTSPA
jgi:aminoglycoside 6'-N-acetyltransferase